MPLGEPPSRTPGARCGTRSRRRPRRARRGERRGAWAHDGTRTGRRSDAPRGAASSSRCPGGGGSASAASDAGGRPLEPARCEFSAYRSKRAELDKLAGRELRFNQGRVSVPALESGELAGSGKGWMWRVAGLASAGRWFVVGVVSCLGLLAYSCSNEISPSWSVPSDTPKNRENRVRLDVSIPPRERDFRVLQREPDGSWSELRVATNLDGAGGDHSSEHGLVDLRVGERRQLRTEQDGRDVTHSTRWTSNRNWIADFPDLPGLIRGKSHGEAWVTTRWGRYSRTLRIVVNSGGTDRTGVIHWTIEDGCSDGIGLHYRFFLLTRAGNGTEIGRWPSSGRVYVVESGGSQTHSLNASSSSAKVCYGASRPSGYSGSYWGLGLDGRHGCDDCCYDAKTSAQTVSTRLTC